MDGLDRERIDADLLEVEACLRDQVPKATALELDRINLRAKDQASLGGSTRRGGFMRSRIAVTMMLVLGLLLSGTGAGLAVSGISGSGSASQFEYPQEAQGVQGEQASGGQGQANQGTQGAAQNVQGAEAAGGAAQAARQVEVTGGGDELAFTGFVAIPLLLAGVGLIGAGFVLRRVPAPRD
jgi:hypothetical protein